MCSNNIVGVLVFCLFITTTVASINGTTTRSWHCCKPMSCSWLGKADNSVPVKSCQKNGVTKIDNINAQSGCFGGEAYVCNDYEPWVVNTSLAYGFAAVSIKGSTEKGCCTCYKLDFTSGSVLGKSMIVQVTDTPGELDSNQFDLQIPGSGHGVFDGCKKQWGLPENVWGQKYGGVGGSKDCDTLPEEIRKGCYFRFSWFEGAHNPDITFTEVKCPAELEAKSQCFMSNMTINGTKTNILVNDNTTSFSATIGSTSPVSLITATTSHLSVATTTPLLLENYQLMADGALSTQTVGLLSSGLTLLVVVAAITIFIVLRRKKRSCFAHGKNNVGRADSLDEEHQEMMLLNQSVASIVNSLNLERIIVPPSSIKIGNIIGEGYFGSVYKGTYYPKANMNTGEERIVAIKYPRENQLSTINVRKFLEECSLMMNLSHDNVMRLEGIYFTTDNDNNRIPGLILPFMANGDLHTYIHINPALPIYTILDLAIQIAKGMRYLSGEVHSQRIVHRDLAARNCMLDSSMKVVIADFGLSRNVQQSGNGIYIPSYNQDMPVRWLAPECFENNQYSTKSDMWSFGVVIWELCERGQVPYYQITSPQAVITYIMDGQRLKKPLNCTPELYDLMTSCWNPTPTARPDFEEIVFQLMHLRKPYSIEINGYAMLAFG